jgi:hypothetical protein
MQFQAGMVSEWRARLVPSKRQTRPPLDNRGAVDGGEDQGPRRLNSYAFVAPPFLGPQASLQQILINAEPAGPVGHAGSVPSCADLAISNRSPTDDSNSKSSRCSS